MSDTLEKMWKNDGVHETSEIAEKMLYWANAAGDLFDPRKEAKENDITEDKLPGPLKYAWKNLWGEDYGSYCYLIELEGVPYPYNIALINEYAKEDEFSHEDVRARGQEVLKMMKEEGIDGAVYAGMEDMRYYNDDFTDELIVLMPAGIAKEKLERVADMLFKTAYHKDVSYEMYRDNPEVNAFNRYGNEQYMSDAELVEKALDVSDREETGSYMAEILMDSNVSTYKMFEELASMYLNGNEDVRKGIDMAVSALTERSMRKLSETVIDMSRDRDEIEEGR